MAAHSISCWEIPWTGACHGVAKSQRQLSMHADGTDGGLCLPTPPPGYCEEVCWVWRRVWTETCVPRMSTLPLSWEPLGAAVLQPPCCARLSLCQAEGKGDRKVSALRFQVPVKLPYSALTFMMDWKCKDRQTGRESTPLMCPQLSHNMPGFQPRWLGLPGCPLPQCASETPFPPLL